MAKGKDENPENWQIETIGVRGGMARTPYGEMSEALFLTQSFSYPSPEAADARFSGEEPGFIYQRFGNPTTQIFEDRLALIEGAAVCKAQASGMAAVHAALFGLLKAGDEMVAGRALFGSCRWLVAQLLPRYGVETTVVDAADLSAWKAAVRPNTRVFLVETPSNPLLEITDLQGVADIAHEAGARVVVDNVFATPIYQKPLQHGADVVVYSATKHIDGQGRVLGGAILGNDEAFFEESYKDYLRHTGPALSPFNAWVLLKGLETMGLRVARQTETTLRLAQTIEGHRNVAACAYPGLASHPQADIIKKQMTGGGTVLAFDVGSQEAAWRVLNALQIVRPDGADEAHSPPQRPRTASL